MWQEHDEIGGYQGGWGPSSLDIHHPLNFLDGPIKVNQIITKNLLHPKYLEPFTLYDLYVNQRMSIAKVARHLGVAPSTIMKYLKIHDIPTRPLNQYHDPRYGERQIRNRLVLYKGEQDNINEMKRLRDQGLTYQAIADYMNQKGASTKTGKNKWCRKGVWRTLNLDT